MSKRMNDQMWTVSFAVHRFDDAETSMAGEVIISYLTAYVTDVSIVKSAKTFTM